MDLFQWRMLRAALQQGLRDNWKWLTADEIDKILDQVSKLTKIIDLLEGRE
ncbi:hypothetical protein [Dyadobacter arcticus]|uniref:Four helix bundle protein n=1 Tax=Dyadobacter arcticus TaxID=1078754 RepID=A0ABX0UPU9_9BACT|nr:hypothetical protein [Dyadobacter arcticus]NIJ55023.1 hypothetical protein [Dyadobacter arcticus]